MANTDNVVMQLIEKARQKKAAIQKAEKPDWKTNCSFGFSPTNQNDRVNIQTLTNLNELAGILSWLLTQSKNFNEAAQMLGIEANFTWFGYSLADWQSDIQARVNKIQINKSKKELEDLEARLDKLISPEKRAEMELAEIEKLLQ